MFHGGGHLHSAFDEDETLGKVYDSKVIARLPKYLAPVKLWIALGASGMLIRSLAALAIPFRWAAAFARFLLVGAVGVVNTFPTLFMGAPLWFGAAAFRQTSF